MLLSEEEQDIQTTKRRISPNTMIFWISVTFSCVALTTGISYNVMILPSLGSQAIQQLYDIASSKYTSFLWSFITPDFVFPILAGVLIDLALGIRYVFLVPVEYREFNFFKILYDLIFLYLLFWTINLAGSWIFTCIFV